MSGTYSNTAETLRITPGDMHELIRGKEQRLVERIAPLAREHNVWLDLCGVERIDAAGIAALISLYTCAHSAGHSRGQVARGRSRRASRPCSSIRRARRCRNGASPGSRFWPR